MATQLAAQDQARADPITIFRQTISQPAMRQQIKMALPSHISVEKFERVATTAVQTNPDLLNGQKVERRSLFGALVKAAQDGLLPDGREGAIIPFKGKAAWMPMVAGIMKKVRNSGEISTWDAVPVFEKDKFQRLLGDEMRIYHEPYDEGDPGQVVGAYSIVTFKDGSKSKDYLPRWRIEKARNQNPIGKNSLMWTAFYDEGAVKTVIRHHSKRLPQSTDIEAVFERDDTMRGIEGEAPAVQIANDAPMSRLDALEHHISESSPAGDSPADAGPTNTGGDAGASQEGPDDLNRGESTTLASACDEIDRAENMIDFIARRDALVQFLSDADADEFRVHCGAKEVELKAGR